MEKLSNKTALTNKTAEGLLFRAASQRWNQIE